jgi:hypothetical protein
MYKSAAESTDQHRWELSILDEEGVLKPTERPTFSLDREIVVPYDRDGNLSTTAQMKLDLRDGQRIKLTDGHNIQGAGQPHFLHIGASEPYTRPAAYGGQTLQQGPGNGIVKSYREDLSALMLNVEGVVMELGVWWLEAAARGTLETLPVVNRDPVMIGN